MELEFLVVGVAKGSREDLRKLYEKTEAEVFGVALSIVKDTGLAAEVTAETYRRVLSLAYLFNTDLSAEYWILDLAKNIASNVLHDSVLRKKTLHPKQDNLSGILLELVNGSKNDRGSILMACCLSDLRKKDIARLLWYRTGACRKEYKRGLARLSEKFPGTEKAALPARIEEDVKAILPDVWKKITAAPEAEAPLAHISHEELNLESDELIYTDQDQQNALEEKHQQQKKRKRRIIITALVLAVIIVTNLIVILLSGVLKNKEQTEDPLVQFGNQIAIVRLSGETFYQNIRENNALWVFHSETGESACVTDDPIKELITDGSRLFYRNSADGFLYGIDPDGTGRFRLTETPGTCLTLHEGKIYFSTESGISRIDPDGTAEELYASIDTESGDLRYLTDSGLSPYRYAMEFSPENELFFSAGAGKGIYYLKDLNGRADLEIVYTDEAYTFAVTEDSLYFDCKTYDQDKNPTIYLCRIDRESGLTAPIEGFQLGTGAFCAENGLLYFDGCVGTEYGIYVWRLDGSEEPRKISDLRASDLYLADGLLYIYYPGQEKESDAYLKYLPTEQPDQTVSIF